MDFDSTDLAIAEILVSGPKTSNKSIAKSLGLSEPTVATRIRKLEAKSALRVTIQWNLHAIGLMASARLFIRVNNGDESKVAKKLAKFKEVANISQVKAVGVLVVNMNHSDMASIFEVVETQFSKIKGLEVLEISQVLEYVKFRANVGSNVRAEPDLPLIPCTGSTVDITPFDLDIYAAMGKDGRTAYREVARQLDSPESKVRRRVTQLIEEGVWSLNTVVHPFIFGLNSGAVIRFNVTCGRVRAIAEKLSTLNSTIVVGITFGMYNITVVALGGSLDELVIEYAEHVRGLPDILEYELLPLMKTFYHSYDITL